MREKYKLYNLNCIYKISNKKIRENPGALPKAASLVYK
jgi:hypothetical protein